MLGLSYIILLMLIAVFCYLIAPDNTPNADLQTVEIQAKEPGFTQLFIKLKNRQPQHKNLFSVLWSGQPDYNTWMPIKSYTVSGNDLIVQHYIDEDTSETIRLDLKKVAGPQHNLSQVLVRKKYWLGTDLLGRDILSRLLIGTRVSLSVGCLALLVAMLLGVVIGAIAGYYRGKTDALLLWLINVSWSIPTLLLVFALSIAMGKGLMQIYIAVGLTLWVSVARLVRGQMIQIREREYIQAAKIMGLSNFNIIFKHAVPNMMGPLIVSATNIFATAIIIEAGLSFLGLGVQSPQPSWGLMIKENYNFIITHKPILAIIPGLAIMLLVLAFNMVGNGWRDALDVKG